MGKEMSMRAKVLLILALAALMALLAASPLFGAVTNTVSSATDINSALPAGLSESSRTWTGHGVNVLIEQKYLYAQPNLDRAVAYPDVLNYIPYLRYSVSGTASAGANAVVVCLSGLHAGNNGFDYYAKQLVSLAKADKGMNVEVWALDRRVNNLEDLTGLNEAERLGSTGDLQGAQNALNGYYYGGQAINGQTFKGFYTNQSAPWLSEFGLKVCMEDIYTLIKTVFPDQNVRKKRVYVAGDSLGAVMSADFACWDFDGNAATTADIGYNNIAGVCALDALMTPNAVPINQDVLKIFANFLPSQFSSLINTTSLSTYASTLNMLRNGSMDVLMPTSALGYVPQTYLGVEVNAMSADAAPDAESTFYKDTANIPNYDTRSDVILRLCCSKDLAQYLSGVVWQKKVRWTNEALFGIVFDNNFNPITMNESAEGFLTGGPISEKSFPAYGNLDAILPSFIWNPMSGFMCYDKMYIPTSTTALYSWVNSDEIDSDATARKYTSSSDEVSNLHDEAKCTYEGPSNIAEWYYTTRLFADIMIANTSGAQQYGLNLLHANDLSKVPTFIRLNAEGTNIGYARMNGMNTNGITMPGQHLDVLMADTSRDSVSKAVSVMYHPLCDWMNSISGPIQNFQISASAGAGGTISPSGAVTVNYGSSQAFTITPNTGYKIADVLVDGSSVGAVSNYTFSNVTAGHNIAASFTPITFQISASAGAGGTISPSGAVTVNYGSSQAFTITPNTGYKIADVLVDGGSKGAVSSYIFTNITGNHTIAASFKQSTFQIVASAGAGGTISPSGAVTVNYGANQTFNITPNGGYEIANVLVDGSNAGKVNSYTFTNVTVDHTIAASFVPSATPTFQIVASAGAGGSINPTGTVTVSSGSNQTFTITPDSGYDIADVLVDGSSVGAVSSYAFTNVTVDHTIAASFAATTPPPNPCGSGSGAGVLVLGLSLGFVSLLGSEIKKRKKHTRN